MVQPDEGLKKEGKLWPAGGAGDPSQQHPLGAADNHILCVCVWLQVEAMLLAT